MVTQNCPGTGEDSKIPHNRSMFRNLLINYDTLLLQALKTELRADMVTQAQEQDSR